MLVPGPRRRFLAGVHSPISDVDRTDLRSRPATTV